MDIANVFRNIHQDLDSNCLTQLTKDNFDDFFKLTIKEIKSYDKLKEVFDKYELDINKVFFSSDYFYSTWYIDSPCYINLQNLMMIETLNGTIEYKNSLNRLIKNNEWQSLIRIMNDSFRVDFFINHYKMIPKNQLPDILIELYGSREYVLNKLGIEIIKECINGYNVSKIPSNKKKSDNTVIIYRGQTDESTPIEKALSWSLDIKTARWFANRFKSNGKVFKAKAKLSDILFYTDNRSEKEVVIEYDKLIDMQEIK